MKSNWTIRIFGITVISFGLAIFFTKLSGEDKIESYWQGTADALTNKGKFVSVFTEESFEAENLKEINIIASANELKIEKSKDNKIHFLYYKKNDSANNELTSTTGTVMKFHLDKLIIPKNNLKINFNFKNMESFGVIANDVKHSTAIVQLPANIKKIKIDTISGEIKIVDLKLDEVKIESVSGDVKLQGDIKELKSSTVSGDLKFQSEISDPNVKLSTVSGNIKITFYKEPDFKLNFDTRSGNIRFDKNFSKPELDGSVKDLKFGKGSGQFEISTVSGDLEIKKLTH